MARSKKEKPAAKSAIHDVVTRDYTLRTFSPFSQSSRPFSLTLVFCRFA